LRQFSSNEVTETLDIVFGVVILADLPRGCLPAGAACANSVAS
jgi:hypothetical protein